jgi:diguanylate cyclase (GGDEF)-like protein
MAAQWSTDWRLISGARHGASAAQRGDSSVATKSLPFLAFGALCTAGVLLAPRQGMGMQLVIHGLQIAAAVCGGGACLLAARAVSIEERASRRAWKLLGLALVCFALGILVQSGAQLMHLRLPRFPSLPDVFRIAQHVLIALSLFELARIYLKSAPYRRDRFRIAIDTAIVLLAGGVLSWAMLIEPLLGAAKITSLSRSLLFFYAFLDVVVLGGALVLLFAVRGRLYLTRVAVLLCLGAGAMVLTNSVYLYLVLHHMAPLESFAGGVWLELGWIWSCLFFGSAALTRRAISVTLPKGVMATTGSGAASPGRGLMGEEGMQAAEEREERRWQHIFIVWLPCSAALFAALLLIGFEFRSGHGESVRRMLPALLLLLAVVIRQMLTLWENTRLSDRLRHVNFSLEQVNTDLEQNVQDRTQHLATLHIITSTLNTSLDRRTVLRVALERTIAATCADGGGIWLRIAEEDGASAAPLAPTPVGAGAYSVVAQDADTDAAPRMTWELAHSYGFAQDEALLNTLRDLAVAAAEEQGAGVPLIASTRPVQDGSALSPQKVIVVPIRWGGAVLGAFGQFRHRGNFTHEDRALAESVAMETGTALQNARLYQEARHRADRDSVTGLLNHRAMQERLNTALSFARRRRTELAAVMMDLNNFKFFNDTYGHPTGDEVLRTVARHLEDVCRDNDLVGRYGGDEFIVLLPDTGSEGARDFCLRVAARLGDHHFQTDSGSRIPIEMSFGWAVYPRDAESALELLTLADSNLYEYKHSGGFANRSHIEATEEGRIEIRRLKNRASGGSFGVLDALVTAIDNKDHYTRRHSEEVTHYSLLVAKELNYSEEALRAVRISGLLHDVGKIAIPDEILRHPGELGKDEWEIMRQHPAFGALIVKDLPHLDEVLDGVRHHHERWDGKGYPDGLKENDIPMMGRLLAAGDCFSAMTTNRPYRKAFSPEDALREIERGSGIQFDPMIAKTFVRVMRREISNSTKPQDAVPTISSDEMEAEISKGVLAASNV